MLVKYDIGTRTNVSEVIKENEKTVWVKAPDGKTIIKRHKEKHNVVELEGENET